MKYILIIIILLFIVAISTFLKIKRPSFLEEFDNYTLAEIENTFASPPNSLLPVNSFPKTEDDVLVQGEFPITHRNGISNNGASNIWWHYPIFELGSYKQITNNIRYSNNPDEGTCMPASMCGALYKERQHPSNIVSVLPPVNSACGTRVGYFTTDVDLLPFRTGTSNILY